jgi:hypothetical protein
MRTGSWRFQWLAVAVVAAAGLAAVGIAQTAAGRSLLRKAGLTAAPARYTELAFAHPMLLPEKFPNGRFKVRAPFTIQNVGRVPRSYDWTVVELAGGRTITVAHGNTSLDPGIRRAANPPMWLHCEGQGRVHVEVRLADPAESIGWWARCLPPGQPKAVQRHR